MTTAAVSPPALACEFLTLTPEELRTEASLLSPDVVSRLASVLETHQLTLSRDLGLSMNGPVDHELWAWCRKPGSTVFVLASVLKSLGLQACFAWIHTDMEEHLMRLHLAIEGAAAFTPGGVDGTEQPQFQQVSTNSQFSIRLALETHLGDDLTRFQIIGPASWVTWDTPASYLRGRQLTLRYTNETQSKENQAFSLESESTKLKKLHHDDEDSTDVKKLFMHENGFLGSGETFVKGVSHYDRDPEAGSEYNGDRVSKLGGSLGSEVEAYSFSATSLKHVIRSVESKQIDDDDDEIQLKHTSQHETYVKEIYVDVTQDSYEESFMPTYSNNPTPMDSTEQREGELGLSESVIAHAPGTIHNLNLDTFNEPFLPHFSNATSKLPISIENIHQEISNSKNLPNKDMPKPHCQALDGKPDSLVVDSDQSSQVCSKPVQPSLANVPNLSLLDTSSCMTEMSMDSNFPPSEEKRNNLNCISVSTAASLFKANCLDSPRNSAVSLAERMQFEFRDMSPEEGDKSNSNNQILDGRDGEDGIDIEDDDGVGGCSKDFEDHNRDDVLDDHNGKAQLEISNGQQCDHQTIVKSLPAEALPMPSPPIKRQKSNDLIPSDNLALQPMGISEGINTGAQNLHSAEAQPELNSNNAHYGQQDSVSISQDSSHELFLPKDNLLRYTPPPPYLGRIPPFQPPPYSSVAQNLNGCPNPSISQFSRSSQPMLSNPPNNKAEIISYTNVPGHLSAPAQLPAQHGRVPSSVHYMTMSGPEPATNTAKVMAEIPLPTPCSSSHSQNAMLNRSHNVTSPSENPPFVPNFYQGSSATNIPGAIKGNVFQVNPTDFRPSRPVNSFNGPQEPPFHPAPHVTRTNRQNTPLTAPAARHNDPLVPNTRNVVQQCERFHERSHPAAADVAAEEESEHYVYPDQVGAVGGAVRQPRLPLRSRISLEDELRELPGWCPDVNGDNIQEIMRDFQRQDGAFIIWRSRRHNKFVITVSHQGKLIHLLVMELPPRSRDGGPVYYLFEKDGVRTDSILGLFRHYQRQGIRMYITSQEGWQHLEHIQLRGAIKVRMQRRRR